MKYLKRIGIVLLVSLFLALLPIPDVEAAAEDTITITVTVKDFHTVIYEDDGVTNYTTWAIGAVDKSSTTITPDANCLFVKNESNVACDFQYKGSDTANWTISNTVSTDVFVLMAICMSSNASAPTAGNFSDTYDDLTTAYQTCTSSAGNGLFEGDTDGASVAANTGVYVYLCFKAPSDLSAAHAQQTITFYAQAITAA